VVVCGELAGAFTASKIFHGFRIYFGVIPVLGMVNVSRRDAPSLQSHRAEGSAIAQTGHNAVAVVCSSSAPPKSCHFDRSCSRFCEQRSGEIRFSTHPVPQPQRLRLLVVILRRTGILRRAIFARWGGMAEDLLLSFSAGNRAGIHSSCLSS